MNTLKPGPCWRIAPSGTTECYLLHYDNAAGNTASVCSRGQRSRWAVKPMQVAAADLFASQEEARAEYRRRRAVVETTPGRKAFNLTSSLALLACLAFATPAAAQGWQYHTTPLGGGWSTTNAQGPNGEQATGTTTPLGGGWSTTTWQDNRGHSSTCTTTPLGGGFSTTSCQ